MSAVRAAPVGPPEALSTSASSRPSRLGGVLLVMVGCLLLVLAADRVARGVAAIQRPVEAMYGEAIIYDQAARLLRGEALYQPLDRPPFTVSAYTPLYYAVVAGLRMLAGPGFGPGRMVSFGTGLCAAILVGRLAARRAADRRAGLFAAALFLGLGFPGDYPWFAFYKEDMLGVALSLGAITALDRGCDRRRAVCAGVFAGLAFLTKQTFVAASLAGFVWLWYRNRASAATFAASVLAVAGVPCVLLALSSGAFLDNTVRANVNLFRADVLLSNLAILERYQGVALRMTLLPAVTRTLPWRHWLRDPLGAFWLVSLVLLPLELAKVGSNWNYWIESAAATAVLATRGMWELALRAGVGGFGRIAAWVALLALLASPVWLPRPSVSLGTVAEHTLQPDTGQATEFAQVLERVRTEPRGVLAEPLDIVALADREILLEPYVFSILHRGGQWDASPAVRQICAGQVGLLVLDHPLEDPDWEFHGYPHWPTPVRAALRATMYLDRVQARLFLYVPRAAADAATSNDAPPPPPCRGFV
jgi:hypothetical protein